VRLRRLELVQRDAHGAPTERRIHRRALDDAFVIATDDYVAFTAAHLHQADPRDGVIARTC